MRNKHLVELAEYNWFREADFTSQSDGQGNWIFGEGTYVIRMKGTPAVNEGTHSHMRVMMEIMDKAAEQEKQKIELPSISWMKKIKGKDGRRHKIWKIAGHEIFVNTRLLLPIMKVLHGGKGYVVRLDRFSKQNKKRSWECIYIKADNGDAVLCPMLNTRERILYTGKVERD